METKGKDGKGKKRGRESGEKFYNFFFVIENYPVLSGRCTITTTLQHYRDKKIHMYTKCVMSEGSLYIQGKRGELYHHSFSRKWGQGNL